MTCHVEVYHDDLIPPDGVPTPEWGWQCFTCPADSGTIFYTFVGAEFDGEIHAERVELAKAARS